MYHRILIYFAFSEFLNLINYSQCTRTSSTTPFVPISIIDAKGIFGNPNFIRNRNQNATFKVDVDPELLPKPQDFTSAWEDYCAPYHCNDYHKPACGLNRRLRRFRWFQSACHLIINNQCTWLTGFLKFDIIEDEYCTHNVLNLRSSCEELCSDVYWPVCGQNDKGQYAIFENRCLLARTRCDKDSEDVGGEFKEVPRSNCKKPIIFVVKSKHLRVLAKV